MTPKDLLITALTTLWDYIGNSSYIFFLIGVAIIVIVCKILKSTVKTLLKCIFYAVCAYSIYILISNLL